jgi:hypothetical protein
MAAMRLQPEENDLIQEFRAAPAAASDDERSLAADSWSVKSDYGSSALGDDQRQADADVAASFPATASDYRFLVFLFYLHRLFVFQSNPSIA